MVTCALQIAQPGTNFKEKHENSVSKVGQAIKDGTLISQTSADDGIHITHFIYVC